MVAAVGGREANAKLYPAVIREAARVSLYTEPDAFILPGILIEYENECTDEMVVCCVFIQK